MSKKGKDQTQAQAANTDSPEGTGATSLPDSGAKTPEAVGQAAGEQPQGEWPRLFEVTNNTPIALHLSECGVNLAPNYMAPQNTAQVTFVSQDALTRELSNAEAIGAAHGFTEPLIVQEAD